MEWPVEGIDPQATYHDEPGNFRMRLAFAAVGKVQIEVVQPLEGENIYSDFLRDHGPGLHHFRLSVPAFEKSVEGNGRTRTSKHLQRHRCACWVQVGLF